MAALTTLVGVVGMAGSPDVWRRTERAVPDGPLEEILVACCGVSWFELIDSVKGVEEGLDSRRRSMRNLSVLVRVGYSCRTSSRGWKGRED